jgi:hypothetical protein
MNNGTQLSIWVVEDEFIADTVRVAFNGRREAGGVRLLHFTKILWHRWHRLSTPLYFLGFWPLCCLFSSKLPIWNDGGLFVWWLFRGDR